MCALCRVAPSGEDGPCAGMIDCVAEFPTGTAPPPGIPSQETAATDAGFKSDSMFGRAPPLSSGKRAMPGATATSAASVVGAVTAAVADAAVDAANKQM